MAKSGVRGVAGVQGVQESRLARDWFDRARSEAQEATASTPALKVGQTDLVSADRRRHGNAGVIEKLGFGVIAFSLVPTCSICFILKLLGLL